MQQCTTVADIRDVIRHQRRQAADGRIAIVPTMGALHDGHVSLMEAARRECDFVVATIFVNPTQFAPGEDLDRYPRPLTADLEACRAARVDAVFHPAVDEMYPADAETFVSLEQLPTILEGAHRPDHFRGVATVVTKLFNIVQPDVAYFGQKDYQQQLLIRRMCRDLDLPVEVRTCPIVREPDGLARSSRNVYLSAEERSAALVLYRALQAVLDRFRAGEARTSRLEESFARVLATCPQVDVDYAVVRDASSLAELEQIEGPAVALVAARVGRTRLIDNELLTR